MDVVDAAADSTLYRALGVEEGATDVTIRLAYKTLVRRLHPDGHIDAAAAEQALVARRMREVNGAWAVLGDSTRRRAYDMELRAARRSAHRGRSTPGSTATDDVHADDRGFARDRVVDRDADAGEASLWTLDDANDEMVELDSAEVLLLRRGMLILGLLVALVLFVGTAYAGSHRTSPTPTSDLRRLSCVDTPAEPCGPTR